MSVVFFLHYHDDMDIQIPYFDKVVLFGSILAGLIFILKINYRWQAIAVARKAKTKFSISMSGIRNLAVYELIYVAPSINDVIIVVFICRERIVFVIGWLWLCN